MSSKIRDSKFLNLIRKFLKAGYMENWVYHKTYSGTPQGGILSPILANIYLNELEKKVKLMSNDFEVFLGNRRTHVYNKQRYRIMTLKKQYSMLTDPLARKEMLQQIHKAKVELRKLPSKNATDKKLAYVRYADDFIIGISGTRKEAEKIKEELKLFLQFINYLSDDAFVDSNLLIVIFTGELKLLASPFFSVNTLPPSDTLISSAA